MWAPIERRWLGSCSKWIGSHGLLLCGQPTGSGLSGSAIVQGLCDVLEAVDMFGRRAQLRALWGHLGGKRCRASVAI